MMVPKGRPARAGAVLGLGLVLAVGGLTPAADAAAMVPVRSDLGTPAGDNSAATAINASGTIVGNRWPGSGTTALAFRWTSGGGMVDVGTLGGAQSNAVAISDAGMIIGNSNTAGGDSHGFAWDAAHGMTDLGTLGTGTTTTPAALNESGLVVGQAKINGTTGHAFAWTRAGGIVDLGTLGGSESAAVAVNESGVVVGWSWTAGDASYDGFVWDAVHGMVNVGSLGGTVSPAMAINDVGEIAGISNGKVFLRDTSATLHDLGRTAGGFGAIVAIDPSGRVIGWGFDEFEQSHGFVATTATGLIEFDAVEPLGVVAGASPDGRFIVGSTGGFSFTDGFVRTESGVQLLDEPSGEVQPAAVNDAGIIAGRVISGGHFKAARWTRGAAAVVALGNAAVVEGDSGGTRTVKFAVTLSTPATALVTVPYTIARTHTATRATPVTDFVEKGGTVKFKPAASGFSTKTQFVTATIKDDGTTEPDETYVVSLGAPSGGGFVLGVSVQTATILDRDPPPGAPTVSVGDASVWEGDTSGTGGTVSVPVTLAAKALAPMSVRVTVSNGTATSPSDFKALAKTVKFAMGARQAFVVVKVVSDTTPESNKTAVVTLSSPTGGLALGRANGLISILDDDT